MKRILVVDDDRATRHLIVRLLEKAKYAADEAPDGAAALEQYARKKYDVVLLDVWMPGLNGLEVLHQLQQQKRPPRVIVMTSDDAPETVIRAVREQAYHYLGKPVDADALLDTLEQALSRRAAPLRIEVVSARPNWVELLVPCDKETAGRIHGFMQHLRADLPEKVRDSVGQAFHELLLNAVEWGGKLDPKQKVRISCVRTKKLLLYRIADPGQGFQFKDLIHCALSNPDDHPYQHTEIREAQGLRPGGFGILMTRSMVDELVYNEKQNEVLLVKYL